MNTQTNDPIHRTSPARVGKMMAIMLGICLVGGAIFFGMWDYWISQVPAVVADNIEEIDDTPAQATGKKIQSTLSFVESDDFITLAFNALPGDPDSNPTINANVGDEITFDVTNDGISFHAFGVTKDTSGVTGIIPSSKIASVTDALKPNESDSSTFVPTEAGQYYYICTVPGHREQGMVGTIIVGEAESSSGVAADPTGVSHNFDVSFIEADDYITMAFNALPGEENHNPDFVVNSGDEVTFTATNAGISIHAFGITTDPSKPNNTVWDSEIALPSSPLTSGKSGTVTFTAGIPGQYYYICTVPGHASQGMSGSFIVE